MVEFILPSGKKMIGAAFDGAAVESLSGPVRGNDKLEKLIDAIGDATSWFRMNIRSVGDTKFSENAVTLIVDKNFGVRSVNFGRNMQVMKNHLRAG